MSQREVVCGSELAAVPAVRRVPKLSAILLAVSRHGPSSNFALLAEGHNECLKFRRGQDPAGQVHCNPAAQAHAQVLCGGIMVARLYSVRFSWTTSLTTFNVASWWYLGGASMATIERNSNESGPVHDFAWHRAHRARRDGQLIDVVTLAGWAALVGWVMLLH
jgi:hypothetical protein